MLPNQYVVSAFLDHSSLLPKKGEQAEAFPPSLLVSFHLGVAQMVASSNPSLELLSSFLFPHLYCISFLQKKEDK